MVCNDSTSDVDWMWILKNSKDLLQYLKLISHNAVNSSKIYDLTAFSMLY